MRVIEAAAIEDAVRRLCVQANIYLPDDVKEALESFRAKEDFSAAGEILDQIIQNYRIAEECGMPVCQDTGAACVFLEIGQDVYISGSLVEAVDEGVRKGYREGYLRGSIVADPLRRINTGDNTPAVLYTEPVAGSRVKITVAPKGFGSENMSAVKMLRPADGAEGVIDFVLSAVQSAGSNPCPPMIVGVGIGGTFDKAALIAKKALLRKLGEPNPDPYYAELEQTLLRRINALGIGPQGFGGRTTALGVAVNTMPTHIAGLPAAVNINCHVARHASEVLE